MTTGRGQIVVKCSGAILILFCCFFAGADTVPRATLPVHSSATKVNHASSGSIDRKQHSRKWFWVLGLTNTYPHLESEKLVRRYWDPIVNALGPGYGHARTVGDLRDRHMIWTPNIGIGRVLSDYWVLYVQAGYTAGVIRTRRNPAGLLLFPVHSDFEIQRGALYSVACLNYYPWKIPRMMAYNSWKKRLKASRPSVGLHMALTRATYHAKAKLGMEPLGALLRIKVHDSWILPSANLNLSWDIPLDERNILYLNGGYTFFTDVKEDFEGGAVTINWKHYFK